VLLALDAVPEGVKPGDCITIAPDGLTETVVPPGVLEGLAPLAPLPAPAAPVLGVPFAPAVPVAPFVKETLGKLFIKLD
jgi:hypothetical protein